MQQLGAQTVVEQRLWEVPVRVELLQAMLVVVLQLLQEPPQVEVAPLGPAPVASAPFADGMFAAVVAAAPARPKTHAHALEPTVAAGGVLPCGECSHGLGGGGEGCDT